MDVRNNNILRYFKHALIVMAFISGLSVISIILTLKAKNEGDCIVLAKVEWTSKSKVYYYHLDTSSSSCSFIMLYQGIACAVCLGYCVYVIFSRTENVNPRILPWFTIECIIAALFSLICAIIFHIGLHKLCNGFLEKNKGYTCEEFESFYDGDKFISLFKGAQVSAS
ncbi:uncharacterized protein [Antedon mediterranea]|uniref:uncharacterized protein isoform X1 n=1 Tax=Antedon mediterranea TaxID=105859 RepID=UPI003AF864E5